MLALFFCFLSITQAKGQAPQSLVSIIQQLETERGITFSYDPDLLQDFSLIAPNRQLSTLLYLDQLTKKLPFTFEQIEEGYVVVAKRPVAVSVVITDAETKAVVPGIYVLKNGEYLPKTSDPEGQVDLMLDWSKSDTLSFVGVGFLPTSYPLLALALDGPDTVALQLSTRVLDELVIQAYLAEGISAHQRNQSIQIKNGELGILPGDAGKDLLVSLRTLPGIQTVTGRAGELRVRGGTPDQTLMLFNNIPIYHRGYFYGTISPFSTDVVDEVRVYRSGFGPEKGGRVGGAIELLSSSQVPDSVTVGLSSNTYFANAFVRAPIKKDQLGITVAGRSSHPFRYGSPKEMALIELALAASSYSVHRQDPDVQVFPPRFDFWDLNTTLTFQNPKFGNLKVNTLQINNEVGYDVIGTISRVHSATSLELSNQGLSADWDKTWGAYKAKVSGVISQYTNDNIRVNTTEDGNLIDSRVLDNQIENRLLRTELERKFGSTGANLSVGLENSHTITHFSARVRRGTDPERYQLGPINTAGWINSMFVNGYLPDWNRLSVEAGLRGSHYQHADVWRLEPRIFTNYAINQHLSLKASFGVYSQQLTQNIFFNHSDVPEEKQLWFFVANDEDNLIRSHQVLTGLVHQNKQFIFDLDLYYKFVSGISTNYSDGENTPGQPSRIVKATGDLRSYGADMLVKYRWRNLDLWGTYTLSRAELIFEEIKTTPFPANFDQTHVISLASSFQKGPWRASLGWIFSSGIPNYTGEFFFPTNGPNTPFPESPTDLGTVRRFESLNQVDASANYVWLPGQGHTRITMGVSVLNLFNRRNLLEISEFYVIPIPGQGMGPQLEASRRFTIAFAPDVTLKVEF